MACAPIANFKNLQRDSELVGHDRDDAVAVDPQRHADEAAAERRPEHALPGIGAIARAVRGAHDEAVVVEKSVLDPIHRQRHVPAAVDPRVQRAAGIDDERFDRLARARQEELPCLSRRQVADDPDHDLANRLLHDRGLPSMRPSRRPMDVSLPQLRPVEAFPVEVDGRRLICVHDPLQYAGELLLVAAPAFFILTLLDGAHSMIDVQEAWAHRFGTTLDAADVRRLIATLDRHHYLQSERFAAHRQSVVSTFLAAPVRPAAHAGKSYPDEPAALRRHLDGFFAGIPARTIPGTLRGLVTPHIDLRVGGAAYGHAYAALAAASDAERFVILGTAHQAGPALCAATRKDFATPLGTVATDRAFLDRLARRTPEDLYAGELLHRVEHAVEFQVVLLRHLLGERRSFSIVPLLIGSFHDMVQERRSPQSDRRVTGFVEALRATLAEDPRPSVVIAAVDLAHVGAKFGDAGGLTPELMARTEAKDRRLVEALERTDRDGFFAEIAADADGTRVCGFAPLYAFLGLMDGTHGRLLHYDRSRDEATDSSVSYASLAFTAGG